MTESNRCSCCTIFRDTFARNNDPPEIKGDWIVAEGAGTWEIATESDGSIDGFTLKGSGTIELARKLHRWCFKLVARILPVAGGVYRLKFSSPNDSDSYTVAITCGHYGTGPDDPAFVDSTCVIYHGETELRVAELTGFYDDKSTWSDFTMCDMAETIDDPLWSVCFQYIKWGISTNICAVDTAKLTLPITVSLDCESSGSACKIDTFTITAQKYGDGTDEECEVCYCPCFRMSQPLCLELEVDGIAPAGSSVGCQCLNGTWPVQNETEFCLWQSHPVFGACFSYSGQRWIVYVVRRWLGYPDVVDNGYYVVEVAFTLFNYTAVWQKTIQSYDDGRPDCNEFFNGFTLGPDDLLTESGHECDFSAATIAISIIEDCDAGRTLYCPVCEECDTEPPSLNLEFSGLEDDDGACDCDSLNTSFELEYLGCFSLPAYPNACRWRIDLDPPICGLATIDFWIARSGEWVLSGQISGTGNLNGIVDLPLDCSGIDFTISQANSALMTGNVDCILNGSAQIRITSSA